MKTSLVRILHALNDFFGLFPERDSLDALDFEPGEEES